MAKELVTGELWETIEPLLPPEPPKPQGGRPRIDNRAALTGIIFVLKYGIPWEMLPKELIKGWDIGTNDTSGQLRAERYGDARVYALTYQGFDKAGNTANCEVTVPKKG
jgi:transposase